MIKLPKYVHAYTDRLGKPRFYYRRNGVKRVPLPGLPWSPDFMTAYTAAEASAGPPARGRLARAVSFPAP